MEQEEIGTKATRAGIIQTLQDRKYLQGTDRFFVSDLGFEVTEVLLKYCPTIVSPELTRKLEEEMNQIQQGTQTKQTTLQNAIETLTLVTSALKEKEAAVGAQLSRSLQKSRLNESTVGLCPKCHEGKLVILRSKKSGKRFVGCTNFFEGKCNTSFPLPQTGTVKPPATACKSCGSPTVAVYLRGRRPWKLCLNSDCPLKGDGI
jgi:DNA topoisomerase-1